MTKRLLDIEKLDNDLKTQDKCVEGIMGYNYSSLKNCGNFSIDINDDNLNQYWVEVEVEE